MSVAKYMRIKTHLWIINGFYFLIEHIYYFKHNFSVVNRICVNAPFFSFFFFLFVFDSIYFICHLEHSIKLIKRKVISDRVLSCISLCRKANTSLPNCEALRSRSIKGHVIRRKRTQVRILPERKLALIFFLECVGQYIRVSTKIMFKLIKIDTYIHINI